MCTHSPTRGPLHEAIHIGHKHGHGEHVGQNLGVAIDAAELQNGRAVLGIDVARGGVDGVREVKEAGSMDVRTISAADGNSCVR